MIAALVVIVLVARSTSRTHNPSVVQSTDTLREFGRYLFYDATLSVDSSTSCGTCHQQFAAFAHIDHAVSHGVLGRIGTRNVPALQNLQQQTSFMWDGAFEHLAMQSINPLTGHAEMGSTLPDVLARVARNPRYQQLASQLYDDTQITIPRILEALAAFTGSIVSRSSRYDAMRDGKLVFNENEQRGLDEFRTHCASCHAEPYFMSNDFASNGLPPDTAMVDVGRYRVTQREEDRYRFRVPSLRNIAITFPYMHDGRFRRLRDVLDHYGSPSKHTPYADSRVTSIAGLSDVERKDIIAFLLTLTDTLLPREPRYRDPYLP
jgi:cytochrome c peroxidase